MAQRVKRLPAMRETRVQSLGQGDPLEKGMASHSSTLAGTQAGIKIARRHINNLRYVDDTTLTAESVEELKSFLLNVKEESENKA